MAVKDHLSYPVDLSDSNCSSFILASVKFYKSLYKNRNCGFCHLAAVNVLMLFFLSEWDDVVVVRQRRPATLICTHTPVEDAITINWKAKSIGAEEWQLVLSASKEKTFFGSAFKTSMQLTDPNFIDTGVFSLSFLPKMEDSGLYSCLVMQKERILKEKTILLAILTGRKTTNSGINYAFAHTQRSYHLGQQEVERIVL